MDLDEVEIWLLIFQLVIVPSITIISLMIYYICKRNSVLERIFAKGKRKVSAGDCFVTCLVLGFVAFGQIVPSFLYIFSTICIFAGVDLLAEVLCLVIGVCVMGISMYMDTSKERLFKYYRKKYHIHDVIPNGGSKSIWM